MTVLFINTCVRKESRTYRLASHFLSRWSDKDVTEVQPVEEGLYGLDRKMLQIRDEALAKKDLDHPVLKYAAQFAKADTILIAAPYWDLSFPAALKNYIERINCVGVTFDYNENGLPYGMCQAKRLVYISTAGGPVSDAAFGYGYLKALCKNFYEIDQTVCFQAENLDMPFVNVEEELNKVKAAMDAWIIQNQ